MWMADDLDAAPLDNNNTMKKVGVRNWVCIVRSFLVYDSSVGRFLLLLSSQTSTSPGLGSTSTILYCTTRGLKIRFRRSDRHFATRFV